MGRKKVIVSVFLKVLLSHLFCLGDIIIMNNVFEFFADVERVKLLWQFVFASLKGSSKLLISVPSVEESLESVGVSR